MLRGQEFATFKMMLGAVFAVALLGIVYYVVAGINSPYTGFDATASYIKQAKQAPGNCFGAVSVPFQKGEEITAAGLVTNTGANSVTLVDKGAPQFTFSGTSALVNTKGNVAVTVSCSVSKDCTVYFGSASC